MDRPLVRLAVTVALAYFVLAAGAIWLTRLSDGVALVWLANGMLLAILGPLRPARWPAVLAACFVATFLATFLLRGNVPGAIGLGIANLVEPVVALVLLRHWHAHRRMFEDVNSVLLFALAAGIVAPAISAPIAAVTNVVVFGNDAGRAAFDWWLGHGLGMLIAAPLAVLIAQSRERWDWRGVPRADMLMFAGLMVAVLACTIFVFAQERLPLLFLPALPVMIATFRLGRAGAALALIIVAVVGGTQTLLGHGPMYLVEGSDAFRLQFFQFYLGTLFLLALPPAAMLARQRKLTGLLRENEAALRLLADHSGDMLLSLEVDGTIRFASPSVRVLFGFEPTALVGRIAAELIEPEYRDAMGRSHRDAVAAPETNVTAEFQARHRDGSIGWFESNSRAVRGPDGDVASVVCAIRDVGHRKSVERKLKLAADTDPLTGLANRRPFMVALDRAIAEVGERPATIVLLDVDHFKQVNDRHGHAAGDAALIQLAETCRRVLRGDDLVARVGGEEFAVLLRGADLAIAEATCERLRIAIGAQPILAPPAPLFRVTASFGVAPVAPNASGEALLAAADAALYAAKHAGRNRVKVAA